MLHPILENLPGQWSDGLRGQKDFREAPLVRPNRLAWDSIAKLSILQHFVSLNAAGGHKINFFTVTNIANYARLTNLSNLGVISDIRRNV